MLPQTWDRRGRTKPTVWLWRAAEGLSKQDPNWHSYSDTGARGDWFDWQGIYSASIIDFIFTIKRSACIGSQESEIEVHSQSNLCCFKKKRRTGLANEMSDEKDVYDEVSPDLECPECWKTNGKMQARSERVVSIGINYTKWMHTHCCGNYSCTCVYSNII